MKVDRAKTLNELENTPAGQLSSGSHVVTETHRLRGIPLAQLRVEDMRLLVGQEIGLDYIVPLALDRLEEQPLAAGDFYSGDLLVTLLRLPATFWTGRPDWRRRLLAIAKPVVDRFAGSSHTKREKFSVTIESLIPAYEAFSRVDSVSA